MAHSPEFTALERKNNNIRKKLAEFVAYEYDKDDKFVYKQQKKFWRLVNGLIENEIQQEEMCGQ